MLSCRPPEPARARETQPDPTLRSNVFSGALRALEPKKIPSCSVVMNAAHIANSSGAFRNCWWVSKSGLTRHSSTGSKSSSKHAEAGNLVSTEESSNGAIAPKP